LILRGIMKIDMYKIKPCFTLLVVFALFSTPVMASQQAELYL